MRLFSYILTHDTGFAPNPFHGYCTLATCKPRIRSTAQVGDWVIGTGGRSMQIRSKRTNRSGFLIYAMKVTEVKTFEEYWSDPRFHDKRPRSDSGKKGECGDNIYFRDTPLSELEQIEGAYHCSVDQKRRDTSVNRVLVSEDFVYWGNNGPPIPPEFVEAGLLSYTQGHKCRFPEKLVISFVQWLRAMEDKGVVGKPMGWSS